MANAKRPYGYRSGADWREKRSERRFTHEALHAALLALAGVKGAR